MGGIPAPPRLRTEVKPNLFQVIPDRSISFDVNKQKRELIAQLERKNRWKSHRHVGQKM